jgi:hydroxymethylpyrimidine pyrophosphatase-like HAD family hydrolase/hypoxanthine phosphoribosyltransferase
MSATIPYTPTAEALLAEESEFYTRYPWCLNIYPTLSEVAHFLGEQIDRLPGLSREWHRDEAITNIYLLSCAISDVIDDYLLGRTYDFTKVTKSLPFVRPVVHATVSILGVTRTIRSWRLGGLRRWREDWEKAHLRVLQHLVATNRGQGKGIEQDAQRLRSLLGHAFSPGLRSMRLRVPASFRSQDLTHHDVLALGQKFLKQFADRSKPLLVIGLRTAGSYFAPLLRAYLEVNGCADVSCVTLRPKSGIAKWEESRLAACAAKGGLALVVDEPMNTGSTIEKTVELLKRSGIRFSSMVVLFPIHPSRRDWDKTDDFLAIRKLCFVTLEPEEWHKHQLLDGRAKEQIKEYFEARGLQVESISRNSRAADLDARLQFLNEQKFHNRLKRTYEVSVRDRSGRSDRRYVLAKSVGWGWLGYHAFVAGERLAKFVPPVLGLRFGMLFTEWRLSSHPAQETRTDRTDWVGWAASYVAARARTLRLKSDPVPMLTREKRHTGFEYLVANLSRAYGLKPTVLLASARLRDKLSRIHCPFPALIDAKMRPLEWVDTGSALLKSDFEHHGMGKTEINVTDPAYDLAELILSWNLSSSEEDLLLARYIQGSGDTDVRERLFLNKLLAGMRGMDKALANLRDSRLEHRMREFDRDYMSAWNGLIVHTTRFCARLCQKPANPGWRSPLVVMDIDGVLDKQIFGFPSTTMAGIEAVSMLHAHEMPVIVNTARSVREVKEYSRAYGFIGGVAEYGTWIWDALSDREQPLIDTVDCDQLEILRKQLRTIPGVFVSEDYHYIIRAYTYGGGVTKPLPTLLIQGLISQLRPDRLKIHQTYTDTTIIPKANDKGSGLRQLLTLAGHPDLTTLAIGDSEADLPMFAVATRSFAPSHMSARKVATALGCHIADESYQPGLLSITRKILHTDKVGQCPLCRSVRSSLSRRTELFADLLKVCDESRIRLLLRAARDPVSLRALIT